MGHTGIEMAERQLKNAIREYSSELWKLGYRNASKYWNDKISIIEGERVKRKIISKIRIEYPEKYMGDFFESLSNSLKRRDEWSPNQFDGCKAEYMGSSLDHINMAKVVEML